YIFCLFEPDYSHRNDGGGNQSDYPYDLLQKKRTVVLALCPVDIVRNCGNGHFLYAFCQVLSQRWNRKRHFRNFKTEHDQQSFGVAVTLFYFVALFLMEREN